jgi:SAM-dependent methyltransferase
LPRVSADRLASFYPSSYGFALERGFRGFVQQRLQALLFWYSLARPPLDALTDLRTGTLLDVGCGRGDLGAALIRRGWHVAGVDPSPEACAVARERGVDATVGTLQTVAHKPASFDAAVMRHSLEHVADPFDDLGRIRRVLRPGGRLIVSVPNFGSWERKLFGPAWLHLDLPRHRTHFSPRALQTALSKSGFELLSLRSGGDLSSLLSSVQYRLAGRLLGQGAPAFWTTAAAGAALSPLTTVLNVSLGGGPVIHAAVQRPR